MKNLTKLCYTIFLSFPSIAILSIPLSIMLPTTVSAQDAHYSQFYNAPTLLNPGMTGHISGNYRMALMFRNQWASILSSGGFNTPSLAADFNIDWSSRSSVGFGALFINDRTPGSVLTSTTSLLGLGFHISIDPFEKHYLSIGYQHGIITRRLNVANLTFEDDLIGGAPENFENTASSHQDARMGIVWTSYFTDYINLKIGTAFIHLVPFAEKFIALNNTIHTRAVFHSELEYTMLNGKFTFRPHFLYMKQGTFQQTVLGLIANYNLVEGTSLYFGTSYRFNDAAIIVAGLELAEAIRIAVSYDLNTSALSAVTNGNGSIEISLQYTGQFARSFQHVPPSSLRIK